VRRDSGATHRGGALYNGSHPRLAVFHKATSHEASLLGTARARLEEGDTQISAAFDANPHSLLVVSLVARPNSWVSPTTALKLRGYSLPVNWLEISPDGKTLVEAGGWRDENEGIYVWRTE
jgi:hypothetical protein